MISNPTAIFVYLACLLGAIFWLSGLPRLERLFNLTPAVVYAYFLPALSTSFGVIPSSSPTYDWMVRYLLPVSLLLLMVTVDVRAILRLGGKALVMALVGLLCLVASSVLFRSNKQWALEQKIEAGAKFIQTQAVYEPEKFAKFMKRVEGFGVPVMAGIIPLKSVGMARFMNKNIPGIDVPTNVIRELDGAEDPVETGIQIAARFINDVRDCLALPEFPFIAVESLSSRRTGAS